MTTTLDHPTAETGDKGTVDVCAILSELADSCQTKTRYYREALRVLAEHYGSPYATLRITQSTSTLDERVRSEADDTGMWDGVAEDALLDSQAENSPIARLYGIKGTSLHAAVLAIPVCEQTDHPIGALSVVARCDSRPFAKLYLGELAALVSLVATRARLIGEKGALHSEDDSALKRAIVKATDFESMHDLAFAITNSLKNKFGCNQVTFGQVKSGKVRILSISGLDNVYPKSPGVKHIRQAMEECLDSGEVICFQDEDKWSEQSVATNHRLHRSWHAETGSAPVASIPLHVGDTCVAVLGMSRPKDQPFTADELAKIRETVMPFAPAMALVAKADRGLINHAVDTVKKWASWLLAPRTYRRKTIALAILASVAFFCFAKINYEITVPSQIAPTEIRYFASPFEGTIKACYVDAGDKVERGQLLFEMDKTDLQLQHDRLESDLQVLQLQVTQALVAEDVRSAALAKAEIEVIQARLAIARHNLAESQVRAPTRGTVVSGELAKRIGEVVPMGAPLLEFVPEGDWSIELQVPETAAAELAAGFEGEFACNARPGESLACEIVRIRPTPQSLDGKNVFIAEATVDGNPAWMRAGMEGVAQIDAGKRRVWWVALHRIIDYARLTFWL